MICAIVLAAGESLRMGSQKVLLPLGDGTVITRIVDQLSESTIAHTIAVVSEQGDQVAETLASRDVTVVRNPDPEGDMLSSIRVGLESVPPACQAAMIVLGDQPRISTELVDLLCSEYHKGEGTLLVPAFKGKRGHPFIMAMAHRAEVMRSFDNEGIRGLLHAHPDELRVLPVDDSAILFDMDTMEDYEREVAAIQDGMQGKQ